MHSSSKTLIMRSGETNTWSDLPYDLLPLIADRLALIELIGFRAVCKNWKIGSSSASAESESHLPWFLVYGENSQCLLLSSSGKRYTTSIPELDGATCIASNNGWLLLVQDGSIFFFCPFSRVKIVLPPFNYQESSSSNYVATFSSLPTSQDCIVGVLCQTDLTDMKLYLLRRGANEWSFYSKNVTVGDVMTIKSATYVDGTFYFSDRWRGLVAFDVGKEKWKIYQIVRSSDPSIKTLPFGFERNYLGDKHVKQQLGLEDDVSISTCGTAVSGERCKMVVFNESIDADEESSSTRQLKGVWIHPRYFQVPPNNSW